MAFRKWIPVLAAVALLLGAFTVSAQTPPAPLNCNAQAVPTQARAEGITELVGDVLISCQGGTQTAVGQAIPIVNVQVFLNTNVTSKLLNGSTTLSEALLMIDEPQPTGTAGAAVIQNPCISSTAGSIGICTVAPSAVGVNPYIKGPNMFQGQVIGNNSVLWTGVPIDPPGSVGTRFVRITNVRANANQLGVSSTLIPASILMFISTTPNTALPINNPTQTVAFVQAGLVFSTGSTTATPLAQCSSNNNTVNTTAKLSADYTISFKEGFLTAFKLRSTVDSAGNEAQNIPGKNYSTESGFTNGTLLTGNLAGAGVATQATRVMAKFAGIPTGVTLYTTLNQTNTGAGFGSATLVTGTDTNGAGGTFALAANSPTSNNFFPITSTGTGTGIAVWEVTNANPSLLETLTFGVAVSFTSNTAQNLPGLGTSTAAGTFAPTSTVTTASAGPIPRFADTSGGNVTAVFNIGACVTDILFPFVTNQATFDTGIAIANTSLDVWNTVAQTGPCTLYYFGNTTGGGAAPNAQTSTAVAAGTVLTFTLSTGGTNGIAATPGFQGYMIATCTFQYAHAFVFISDQGSQKLAEGYLGIILDNGANISRVNVNGIGPANTARETRTF